LPSIPNAIQYTACFNPSTFNLKLFTSSGRSIKRCRTRGRRNNAAHSCCPRPDHKKAADKNTLPSIPNAIQYTACFNPSTVNLKLFTSSGRSIKRCRTRGRRNDAAHSYCPRPDHKKAADKNALPSIPNAIQYTACFNPSTLNLKLSTLNF